MTEIKAWKETKEEKEIYTHNHLCVEELVSGLELELDELNRLWSNNDLSCRKIKNYLLNNGIELDTTKREIHKLNKIIRIN
jgi:hypothetical protein